MHERHTPTRVVSVTRLGSGRLAGVRLNLSSGTTFFLADGVPIGAVIALRRKLMARIRQRKWRAKRKKLQQGPATRIFG